MESSELAQLTRALGMDLSHIVRPSTSSDAGMPCAPIDEQIATALTDDEWSILTETGLLPPEPTQAHALGNRTLVDAVLRTAGRNKPWTSLPTDGVASAEAVRKRFARLAQKGVWQALAVADVPLSHKRSTELKMAARHAAALAKHR